MESSIASPASPAVTFHSEASNLRVVKKNARRRPIGEAGDFENVPGEDFQFIDGTLTVTDQADIDWLRNYESFGNLYYEPGATPPGVESSVALQTVIMEKALAGAFDEIASILVAERSALSRPDVIASCEAAINAGGAQLPAVPDVPLHELHRVRMGPTAGETPGVSPAPVPGTPMVDPSTLETPGAAAAPAPPVPAADTVPSSGAAGEQATAVPDIPPVPPVVDQGPSSTASGGAPGTPAS
jgi:hypothetical protein